MARAEEADRMMTAARGMLAGTRRKQERGAETERVGMALDGLIRARAAADGTVSELALDPRVMRLPAVDLAEAVREAVNQAVLAGREEATADVPPIDLAALDDEVAALQTQGLRQLALIGEFTEDLLRRAARR